MTEPKISGIARGKVLFFSDERGYGFIEVEGIGDVFVHYSAIETKTKRRLLLPDQVVELEVIEGKKGLMAKWVRVVK